MIELFLILTLGFELRFVFLSGYATDDMVHLAFVKLRRHKNSPFDNEPPDSVIPGRFGYPMLAHWVISLFPRKSCKAAGKLLNIGYDLVLVAGTWCVARVWLPELPGLFFSPAGLAALTVATSPCLLPITARMKSLGARSMGNVLFAGQMLILWQCMEGSCLVWGILAVLLGLALLASSQFGLQAMVLSLPFLSLFTWNWLPLVLLLTTGTLAAAAFFCPFSVCQGLRDNILHLYEHKYWYCRNAEYGTTAMGRNRLRDIFSLPRLWQENRDLFFGVIFRRNSYLIALYSFPLFWVVLFVATDPDYATPHGLSWFGACSTFALTCVFLLTSLNRFSFLGQAERYFEYAVPMAALVLAAGVSRGYIAMGTAVTILALQVVILLANLAYTNFASIKKSLTPEAADGVVDYLNSHSGLRILTIPMKLSSYYSYACDSDNFYYFKIVLHEKYGMRHRDEEMPWLESPCTDLSVYVERYDINTVIVQHSFLSKIKEERDVEYLFQGFAKVLEYQDYTIYKRER